MNSARWRTNSTCGSYSTFEEHTITPHMQNKCDNKTTCSFTLKDSSFNVSCTNNCNVLEFFYECICKSVV